jgi:hypothetical protein
VARLQLDTVIDFEFRYQHPNEPPGQFQALPGYRLYIQLVLAPRAADPKWRPNLAADQPRRMDAVVDTGTPFTLIPFEFWKPFEADITPLPQPLGENSLIVGGGSVAGTLGRADFAATDQTGRWIAPRPTVALFLNEPATPAESASALRVPLLGLHSHLLTKRRRLRHVGDVEEDGRTLPEWWLEDPLW